MDAEMYGMIPNAKMDALEKAPPENMSRIDMTTCGLLLQLLESGWINTGQYDERAEAVDCHKQDGDEDSLTQILYLPTISQIFY
jgi:hypothetical protein